ncbi:RNA polymerase sigma factor [Nocardioides sediminis]|uniref:RNA polymerase sigma factor n=1 Tax=Nocardioides sediminis TaxID=433648 RepID=UPI000D30ADB3|nr:sigma-70 family RNA polymerase sigma factor [Nocardioides sediminis]
MADEASFDEFYLSTREAVLRQLTAMTLDRELAADAVQEAYARAWQRWPRVSRLAEPSAWVRTVAWRLAISQFRRRAVARRMLRRLQLERDPMEVEASADVAIDVVTALRALSAEHRRVLVLHELVGLSVREVAAETGVAEGTVKSRLSRARERLGVALGPEYLAGPAPAGADVLVREEEGR